MSLAVITLNGQITATGTDKDVFTAGVNNTWLKKITITNRSGSSALVSAYKKSSGGTKRAAAPHSKSLADGASLVISNKALNNGDKIQIDTDQQPIDWDVDGFSF